MDKKKSHSERLDTLTKVLDTISNELKSLRDEMESERATEVAPTAIEAIPTPPPLPQFVAPPPPVPTPPPVAAPIVTPAAPPFIPVRPAAQAKQVVPPPAAKKAKPSFRERFPDLEVFVGQKLIAFIGIAIALMGIWYLVSLAIDQNIIGEKARTFLGIGFAAILVGIAHRLHKQFRVFSSILFGGGIAVLYFSITYAHHVYNLFGPEKSDSIWAFLVLLVITLFTVLFTLLYNRQELGIIATLGAFLTPALVSKGSGDYVALFSYLSMVNIGMLVLSFYRNWKSIHVICFVSTALLFGSWIIMKSDNGMLANKGHLLLFGTGFFVTFFAMNIANSVLTKVKLGALEYWFILLNSFLYFGAGIYLFNLYKDGLYSGIFAAIVALFHFIFALVFYKKQGADKNLILVLVAMVLTFLTLAAPIQLEGNAITLFWAAEAALLIWIAQITKIEVLRVSSLVVMICMVLSLIMDWQIYYIFQSYREKSVIYSLIFNRPFLTGLFVIASLVLSRFLLKQDREDVWFEAFKLKIAKSKDVLKVLPFIALALAYLVVSMEYNYQLNSRDFPHPFAAVVGGLFHGVFALGLLFFARQNKGKVAQVIAICSGFIVFLYFLLHTHPNAIEIRNGLVSNFAEFKAYQFNLHYLAAATVLAVVVIIGHSVRKNRSMGSMSDNLVWIMTPIYLFLACSELDHAFVLLGTDSVTSIDEALSHSHLAGYPVIWGMYAFGLIFLGLKRRIVQYRHIALSLLGFTLLKIFLFDLKNMHQIGKVIAFVSLGVLILIMSFMYQKLRVLFVEDKPNEKPGDATDAKI